LAASKIIVMEGEAGADTAKAVLVGSWWTQLGAQRHRAVQPGVLKVCWGLQAPARLKWFRVC